jgi:hypothetical protein
MEKSILQEMCMVKLSSLTILFTTRETCCDVNRPIKIDIDQCYFTSSINSNDRGAI